jgi:hypothetical protein
MIMKNNNNNEVYHNSPSPFEPFMAEWIETHPELDGSTNFEYEESMLASLQGFYSLAY